MGAMTAASGATSADSTTADPIIQVEHLKKRYGDFTAVEDVSFAVTEGEIFGILGPNGSGKTTVVECLQGLRRPDGGRLRVLDLDPTTEASRLRPMIGSQLQESALPDRIRVWEALDFFSSLNGNGDPWSTVMEEWNLTEKRSASYTSLSGGQRQRLFVALALVNAPKVVFLDEMTTGLDPSARHVAWDLIRRIRDRGTTVILVTHFMDEAEYLCDRIAVIADKRVLAIDTPQGLIDAHNDRAEVTFSCNRDDLGFLMTVDGVEEVTRSGRRITVRGRGPVLARVGAALVADGLAPTDLQVRRATLEDAFLAITGGDD
jgi:ABC-2 type transport system ATP-binding protein